MTTLPQKRYADPLEVLLKAEAETCKGCVHREVSYVGAKEYCGNPLVKQLLADRRCDEYKEPNEN
jgi:hypothetical protein